MQMCSSLNTTRNTCTDVEVALKHTEKFSEGADLLMNVALSDSWIAPLQQQRDSFSPT